MDKGVTRNNRNITNKKELKHIIFESVPLKYHTLVEMAIQFAEEVHRHQKRVSGEAFIYHPLNVAAIMSQLHLDTNSIITAILHNTLKDRVSREKAEILANIEEKFGKEVHYMVSTINSLSKGTRSSSEDQVITKFMLRSVDDLRIIIIKLADRLHNARTIDSLPPEKQKEFAEHLINIYSPLATYLNLYEFKKELEEVAFRILKPREYEKIDKELRALRINNIERMEKLSSALEKLCETLDYEPTIYGRIKGHYSIFKKLLEKSNKKTLNEVDMEMLNDLIAFSIIVKTEKDCYFIAKSIIQSSDVELDQYDDYIKQPKPNGYKSIQFVTKMPDLSSKKFEIQVKTEYMHNFNIYGPASHIAYKLAGSNKAANLNEYYWVKEVHRRIYEYRMSPKSKRSMPISSEIFKNKIYVFTPKSKLVELPIGSTVIDFAYALHSALGHSAVGCKINNHKMGLQTMLRNGDMIDIVTSEKQKLPKREWLEFVRTRKAREAIELEHRKFILSQKDDFTHTI